MEARRGKGTCPRPQSREGRAKVGTWVSLRPGCRLRTTRGLPVPQGQRRSAPPPATSYPHCPPQDLLIISTDDSQVFVAVQEWYQTDTYNLYQSDPRGVRYALVLEDVRSSRQAEEDVVIDILEVGRVGHGGNWGSLGSPGPGCGGRGPGLISAPPHFLPYLRLCLGICNCLCKGPTGAERILCRHF